MNKLMKAAPAIAKTWALRTVYGRVDEKLGVPATRVARDLGLLPDPSSDNLRRELRRIRRGG